MSTGNLTGNCGRLIDCLRSARFPINVSTNELREANPRTILPILHFSLLDLSPHVASFVREKGFNMFALNDAKFTEAVFRLASMHMGLKPHMTVTQFLSDGYTERRLIFAADLVKACLALHEEEERKIAFKKRGPIPPYAGHLMLIPTSASTRDHIRVQSSATVHRGATMDIDEVFPKRAFSYPSVTKNSAHVKTPTDHIFSIGTVNSKGDSAFAARLTSFEANTEAVASKFLNEAILLGQGVGTAITASRRRRM